jgi:hypothetical protein
MTANYWFKYRSLVAVVVEQSPGVLQNAIELSALEIHLLGIQRASSF